MCHFFAFIGSKNKYLFSYSIDTNIQNYVALREQFTVWSLGAACCSQK